MSRHHHRQRPLIRAPLLAAVLLLALPAVGQGPGGEGGPGTTAELPFELGELFPRDDLSVEINLHGALIRLVAEATREDDSDFARMLSGLEGIRVRIAPLGDEATAESLGHRLGEAVGALEAAGWEPLARVREGGEENYLYLKETDGKVTGLVVLFLHEESSEAGLVHIDGTVDPAALGRLARELDLPALGEMDDGAMGDTSGETADSEEPAP